MNIRQLRKLLIEKYSNKVTAIENDGCIVLNGTLSSWDQIVEAGYLAVDKKRYIGVINNIELEGITKPTMRMPSIKDSKLEGATPDVLIIGGGISGVSILRELAKYKLKLLLVEKEADLALQASGRNDGEVHPGVDLKKGSKKQYYVVRGNAMYDKLCEELNVPFRRCGQYAIFEQKFLSIPLKIYAKQRTKDGAYTEVISHNELLKREPNLTRKGTMALYSPTAGVVCPYSLTIAYAENAVQNGAQVSLNTVVTDVNIEAGEIVSVATNRGTVYPRLVINAAGVFAEDIAIMFEDHYFSIHPRKGTNSILDKKANAIIKSIASITTSAHSKGHTKGGGIIRTIDNNILVGPDAIETYEKEDFTTNVESINRVFDKQVNTANSLSKGDIITYFSGIRAATYEEDFYIEKGRNTHNLIHVAGIQSPGLTTAPAVALDVEKMAIEILSRKKKVAKNPTYNPIRIGIPCVREMSDDERTTLIKSNPDYGIIICRCEQISKGEIIDALKSCVGVPTIDGIKKRVRPGMGRCQGGFCSPLVAKIIAEYLDIPLEKVRKSSNEAFITFGSTKEGGPDE